MKLEFEHLATQEQVRLQIQQCEGKHKQQVVYSSYHDALTQICYGCKMIRSNIDFNEEVEYNRKEKCEDCGHIESSHPVRHSSGKKYLCEKFKLKKIKGEKE